MITASPGFTSRINFAPMPGKMQFSDDKTKNARLDINGDTVRLSTEDIEWERDISGNVKEGNNFIRIIPLDEDFDIDLLEIRLE